MRTPFLPPRTWLPYLCVYKIKLLQQKYSALKYVNCLKITLTQGSTVHERSRFPSVEPCTEPPCMVKIRGRDESQWNVFATVYTRLFSPMEFKNLLTVLIQSAFRFTIIPRQKRYSDSIKGSPSENPFDFWNQCRIRLFPLLSDVEFRFSFTGTPLNQKYPTFFFQPSKMKLV